MAKTETETRDARKALNALLEFAIEMDRENPTLDSAEASRRGRIFSDARDAISSVTA
jgi:hypothetical protein